MSNEDIRIGIIGAGENTRRKHIPGLEAMDRVQIIAVSNRSRESSQKVAGEFSIPKIYDSWQELIYDKDIDAVVIGTWPYLHAQATCLALTYDKHVLCEARMAMNAREAHEMLKASQAKPRLTAQIVPSPLTLGLDRAIKRILAEGHIGQPLVVEIRDGGSFLDPREPVHWRQQFEYSGYNILTLGIWYECLMRWIGEAISVTALGKTFVPMRRDADKMLVPVRVPDHLDVCAEMACGAQLHMQLSQVTGHAGPTEAFIFGDKGSIRIADGKIYGAQPGNTRYKEIPVPAELEGGWRVEEEFINSIRGKEKVKLTDFNTGVKYMEFTEAVNRSMQRGCKVYLPL